MFWRKLGSRVWYQPLELGRGKGMDEKAGRKMRVTGKIKGEGVEH